MARDKPHALDAGHVRHEVQQLGERLPGDHVAPVGIDVLPQQGNLQRNVPGRWKESSHGRVSTSWAKVFVAG